MEDQLMKKLLGGVAAAVMLAALAMPGTAAAQKQEPGVYKQTAGEEFSAQRRYYRRYYVRRYWPRYYGYYGSYWPGYYGAYGYPYYPYYYARPYISFGIGPFWGWW
jgi:hypothetical protein